MDKQEVIRFFDTLAEGWDANAQVDPAVIHRILDLAQVTPGCSVCDVATGTGILIPQYQKRQVRRCVALDISPGMVAVAAGKFAADDRVKILCADAEVVDLGEHFDTIVVHNAFPHFLHPEQLFANLVRHLHPGGRLTVAHSMSRAALLRHHQGAAERVSVPLPEAEELAGQMSHYLTVDVCLSTDEMYVVSGQKA